MLTVSRGWVASAVLVLGMAIAVAAQAGAATTGLAVTPARLARVVDGDTIALTSGERVRLLQIDTPEPGTGECYSRASTRDIRRLLASGAVLSLEADPRLDDRDAYGRLLRYVWHRGTNVNLELVRSGSATVWFYRGEKGRYASQLLAAAHAARTAKRGLWGACPRAVWNPYGPATTGPGSGSSPGGAAVGVAGSRGGAGACDPSYPGVCVPPPPPDLDCKDVPYTNFRVLAPDPHRFDGERDGLGCES